MGPTFTPTRQSWQLAASFFLDRLQPLGSGMVELQMSAANLGMFITSNDLRAVVDYLYSGELLVPRQRLHHLLALVRFLQVFGFQSDGANYITGPDLQCLSHTDVNNYMTVDMPGVQDLPAVTTHLHTEDTCDGMASNAAHPLTSIKTSEQGILQDPPKYSEPLKVDTNAGMLGPSTNMSFSQLCTVQSTEGDCFNMQCNQIKHIAPSVFESSVLEDTTTMFKGKTPECFDGYNKGDGDVVCTGTVLHLRAGPDGPTQEGRVVGSTLEAHSKTDHHPHTLPEQLVQPTACVMEGDTDDTYNVMLLEALVANAPSPSVVDVENILLSDEAKMGINPRWLRSRKPLRATADCRARLKVKDSIGGVSLQDTSQRQCAVPSSLPSLCPEDDLGVRDNWMVVLPDPATAKLSHTADPNTLYSQTPVVDNTALPQIISEPSMHMQPPLGNSSLINRTAASNTVPLIASPMSLTTPLLTQNSNSSNLSVLPHTSVASTTPVVGQAPLPNPPPLLTQSNISFTPYLQPSVFSSAVVNQTDLPHIQHTLSVPVQSMSVQSVDSVSPSMSYSQGVTAVYSQSSPSPSHMLTQSSTAMPPFVPSPITLSSSSMSTPSSTTEQDLPATFGTSMTSFMSASSSVPSLLHLPCSDPQPGASDTIVLSPSLPSILTTTTASSTNTNTVVALTVCDTTADYTDLTMLQPSQSTSASITHSSSSAASSPDLESSTACNLPACGSSPTMSWPSSPMCSSTTTTTSYTSNPVPSVSPAPKDCSITTTVLPLTLTCNTATKTVETEAIQISPVISEPKPVKSRKKKKVSSASSVKASRTRTKAQKRAGGKVSTEEGESHRCSQCSKTFCVLDKLTLHLWEEHEVGTLARCQLCDFSSPLQNSLLEHAATHISKECNTCAICGKNNFKNHLTARMHLREHRREEDMFKCQFCPVLYSQKYNLVKHLASVHQRDLEGQPLTQSHSCPHCAFTTLAQYKLKAHILRRHTEDKRFKCQSCSYSTVEKTDFDKHQRTHTNERPYVCDTCGFHAQTLSILWRHKRSHSGVKPYECEQCGQQYADRKRLRDHMYKHNNIKPFMCHLCGYTCRRKDNLQKHLRFTHKLLEQKDGASHKGQPAPAQQGKTKRRRGQKVGRGGGQGGRGKAKLPHNQDPTQPPWCPEVKVKPSAEVCEPQGSSVGPVVVSGEVDSMCGREVVATHPSFTTSLLPPDIQSGECVGAAAAGIQLNFLLPLPATTDPTITLPSPADGVILLSQSQVPHNSKPFL